MVGIRDLARHLDISIGTVSRALNDRADVSSLTRERVRAAADKLGYSPNQSGRSLRRGRTDLVGVIIPAGADDAPINMVFLYVLAGLRRRLSQERLDLAIFLEDRGEDRLESLRRVTERGLVDALIIADTGRRDLRVDYLTRLGKPFVAFGRTQSQLDHAWIDPDFEAAVDGAVQHLVSLGHRRIALTLADRPTNYLDLIARSYRRAMRRRRLRDDEARISRWPASEQGGLAAADALLASDPMPTAVLLSDPMHAVSLYRRLREAGMVPGRELSIVGILPETRAQSLIPALTSYQTDWTAIGDRLGEAVIHELTRAAQQQKLGEALPRRHAAGPMRVEFPVEFRPGDSVGPAKSAPGTISRKDEHARATS